MAPPDDGEDRITLAVVAARMDDFRVEIREDFRELREAVSEMRTGLLPRTEWEQRNVHVDTRFQSHGREIADLRAELRARRQPWTAVASALVALAALAVTLIERLGG